MTNSPAIMPAACSPASKIVDEAIHETADGKRLWVLHGDRFDGVIAYAKWLAHVGDWAYGLALRAERHAVCRVRKRAWACLTGRCRPC